MVQQDYPDYLTRVDRSPVQKQHIQLYGIHSAENIVADPKAESAHNWNIPDDGYFYAIDNIFYFVYHLHPFHSYVDIAPDQTNPIWYTIANTKDDGSSMICVSQFGAFVLSYPNAIRFRIFNFKRLQVTWSVYCNYYKYIEEV